MLGQKANAAGIETVSCSSSWDVLNYLIKKGSQYDIIHTQSSGAQTLAVLSKPFHGRKVVYTRRVDFRINGFLSQFKYRQTDKIVAISQAIADILQGHGFKNVPVIPSVQVPRVLDEERAKALLTQKGISSDTKVIATIAAMVPHKDPLTMVRAIHQLSAQANDFVFLHFGDGPLRASVEEEIEKLGLKDKYLLLGNTEDVEDFYFIFDVFAMSSEGEGLGSYTPFRESK